jgi:prepilin-type N-terminal cleavage/methylation domain-containing protein
MRPERGFTLLETLLALAIGGLVLGAAYTAVVRAASARDQAVARVREVNAGRQALLEMAHALEATAARQLSADAHSLRFVQTEPQPVAITYEMDGTRLVEHRVSPFAATRDDPGSPRVLLDRARTFGVRCFDKGDWVAGWSRDTVPRALELTLALADGEEFRTRVMLPVGGGE